MRLVVEKILHWYNIYDIIKQEDVIKDDGGDEDGKKSCFRQNTMLNEIEQAR